MSKQQTPAKVQRQNIHAVHRLTDYTLLTSTFRRPGSTLLVTILLSQTTVTTFTCRIHNSNDVQKTQARAKEQPLPGVEPGTLPEWVSVHHLAPRSEL
jgi:hypothetical protein